MAEPSGQPPSTERGSSRDYDDLIDRDDLRALSRLAYRELDAALDKAGAELPGDWLQRDPDLKGLAAREDPEWELLVRRSTGRQLPEDRRLPEPARGDPHRRKRQWLTISAICAVLSVGVLVLILIFGFSKGAGVIVGGSAAVALAGGLQGRRLADEARAATARAIAARKMSGS